MTTLGERIGIAAKSSGGVDALSRETGIPRTTLYGYLRDETEPKVGQLIQIAKATKKPIWWFTGLEEEAGGYDPSPRTIPASESFSLVPRYTVQAAAGNGRAVLEEQEADRLAFRADWLRGLGIDPALCGLVTAVGDSQEPTIPNGALMLVDMRPDQSIRSGCFYIIVIDGDALVKRLNRRLDGSIELLSDNPAYPAEMIPVQYLDRLNIPGRVVWFGRTI